MESKHPLPYQQMSRICLHTGRVGILIIIKMICLDDLQKQLDRIEAYSILAGKNVLTLSDVSTLTGLSKSHLYKLTSAKQIPYYRPSGKSLYFDRKEVEDWLRRGKVESNESINEKAERLTFESVGRTAL